MLLELENYAACSTTNARSWPKGSIGVIVPVQRTLTVQYKPYDIQMDQNGISPPARSDKSSYFGASDFTRALRPMADITTELALLTSSSPEQLFDYYRRNRLHLRPWEPLRYPEGPSIEDCDAMISAAKNAHEAGVGVSYCLIGEGRIIGLANFSSISKFPFRACFLGFSIDGELEGRGFGKKMLIDAIEKVFVDYSLNRIMANYMPNNIKSARLLHSIGFRLEGYARNYLEINGTWEDHFLTSLLESEWSARKH